MYCVESGDDHYTDYSVNVDYCFDCGGDHYSDYGVNVD